MPNGYMVVNSRFKPFSYEEMLRPIAAYTDEYNAQEAAYGELANQAAQWERLKNSQIDQDTYQQYRSYADELQKAADALASEGLKPGGRKALQEVRRRYTENIVPIEQAYQRRAELSKLQKEMRAKDPTTLIEREADEIALSELIANPELSPATYSGAYLENSARQAASALSKEMRDDPRKWRSILGGQYYETRMRTGYTAKEIQDAISGSDTAPRELRMVIDQVMQPISGWGNEEAISNARNYTARGLWNAIGEEKYQMAENWMGKLRASQKAQEAPADNLFPGGSFRMASPSETIGATKEVQNRISDILKKGKLRYNNGWVQSVGGAPYTKESSATLFDAEGRLRSREAVMREGSTPEEKASISNAYDSLMEDLGYFGFTDGTGLTVGEINQAMQNRSYEDSPTALNFERIPIDPSDAQAVVGSLLSETVSADGKTLQGVKKIESWDRNGVPKFSSSPVKKEDVLNEDKNGKITVKGSPVIGASYNPNLQGQVITIDGSTYLIEPETFRGRVGSNDLAAAQAELIAAEEEFRRENTMQAYRALEVARSNYRRIHTLPYTVSAAGVNIKPIRDNLFTK